jgi:RecA-family ATPase
VTKLQPEEAKCSWCEQDIQPRRGGSPQRFCSAQHRSLFWSALRRWGEQAIAAGILTINRLYGCDFADLGQMLWLPRLGHDNVLMAFDAGRGKLAKLTTFFDQLLTAAKQHEAKLAIIDTAADTFGGNENDRGQVRLYIQAALGRIARKLDGAVLVCAHPSRSGLQSGTGESGSTGWDATLRSRLYLTRPDVAEGDQPDPNLRVLTRKKANFAVREDTIDLRWKDGVFIPVHQSSGIIGAIHRRTCERVFLDLLDAVTSEGRKVSENPRSGNYAAALFARRPDREGYKKPDFARAMEALFAKREIACITYRGSSRHEHTMLVRSPPP